MTKDASFMTAVLIIAISCIMAAPVSAQITCEFNSLDADGNDTLERTEFNSALTNLEVYNSWDEQGLLVEEEWDRGFQEYYSGYDNRLFGEFSDWDLNEDGQITEEEFNKTLFGMMDSNDNSAIDSGEWDRYSKYLCN